MSLKKRMFRSNMTILCTALTALMLILLLVLVLFEDSFEEQFHSMSQARLDGHAREMQLAVEQADPDNMEYFEQRAEKAGYETVVFRDGKLLAGSAGGNMDNLAEFLENELKDSASGRLSEGDAAEQDPDGGAGVFFWQGATVAAKYIPDEDVYIGAVHFPEGRENSSLQSVFVMVLAVILLVGAAAIFILLGLASFFTRRMNRVVMEPVEKLVEGAQRIQSGNLSQEIEYRGEAEFEHVCGTFNDMQRTILEDKKQREKNEKARTDMVTGISHDLRTPLTSIRGYIKGVLDGVADTPEKREMYLHTAYESAGEMDVLLQKLFDFSRMESGQMPFHMVPVDLAEFTDAYVAQKEAAVDSEKVQIRMHREKETMPEILMDVDQIRRIFDNLLENSIKYAKASPVKIDICVREQKIREKEQGEAACGRVIVLEWKDNGQGVAEEKLSRIFERFYRCDEARNEKGSGVGLYVVQYIMERHSGTVKAENDNGLKIRLSFPCVNTDK